MSPEALQRQAKVAQAYGSLPPDFQPPSTPHVHDPKKPKRPRTPSAQSSFAYGRKKLHGLSDRFINQANTDGAVPAGLAAASPNASLTNGVTGVRDVLPESVSLTGIPEVDIASLKAIGMRYVERGSLT